MEGMRRESAIVLNRLQLTGVKTACWRERKPGLVTPTPAGWTENGVSGPGGIPVPRSVGEGGTPELAPAPAPFPPTEEKLAPGLIFNWNLAITTDVRSMVSGLNGSFGAYALKCVMKGPSNESACVAVLHLGSEEVLVPVHL